MATTSWKRRGCDLWRSDNTCTMFSWMVHPIDQVIVHAYNIHMILG